MYRYLENTIKISQDYIFRLSLWYPLMQFQNNGPFTKLAHDKNSTWNNQIWHPQKWCLTKIAHFAKKCPKVTLFVKDWAEWLIFKRKFLNFLFHPRMLFLVHSHVSNAWVGSVISRMSAVLQKTNNVVARCHLCWVPFLGGGIFDKRSALFVTLCQWVP